MRNFATMMLRDHAKSTADVKAAAHAARVRVGTPMLEPEQSQMIAQLRAVNGADRDRRYIEQQKMAHQKALDLHSGYARNGDVASLRNVAGKVAPVVQHHIEMLRQM